ncbi:MAG: LrgB family protein [Lachnospiraceae bacterium]|nr:LrgB family protein [Lachnospiraceae bacterium]
MNEFVAGIASFGILLTIAAYQLGAYLRKKTGSVFCNPMLVATATVIAVLLVFKIDYATYYDGARFIGYLLTPTTVCLAVPLYKQISVLKEHPVAITCGVLSGVVASMVSIFLFSLLFRLDHASYVTMLPKSITTAIGISLTEEYGGYPAITAIAIMITGITGHIAAEKTCKLFRIHHPAAVGLAIGAASHAMGTSRALEIGEVEGAMSSLALAVCGIVTVIVIPVFAHLM